MKAYAWDFFWQWNTAAAHAYLIVLQSLVYDSTTTHQTRSAASWADALRLWGQNNALLVPTCTELREAAILSGNRWVYGERHCHLAARCIINVGGHCTWMTQSRYLLSAQSPPPHQSSTFVRWEARFMTQSWPCLTSATELTRAVTYHYLAAASLLGLQCKYINLTLCSSSGES